MNRLPAKAAWDVLNVTFWDTCNMNCASTNRFLTTLNKSILQAFQSTFRQAPNMTFGQVLEWFVEQFGQSNKTERQENRQNMKANWSFDNDVKTLIHQINFGLKFAFFIVAPRSDHETVDMSIQMTLRTGLFREAYAAWHARQAVDKT